MGDKLVVRGYRKTDVEETEKLTSTILEAATNMKRVVILSKSQTENAFQCERTTTYSSQLATAQHERGFVEVKQGNNIEKVFAFD